MFQTFADVGNEMISLLERTTQTGQPMEMKDVLARFTTDVIGSAAFGIECNSLKYPETEFRTVGRRAFTQTGIDAIRALIIRSFPKVARLLRIGFFASSVTSFFQKVVRETVEFREKNGVTRSDFMQLLIQLKNNGKVEVDNHSKVNINYINVLHKLNLLVVWWRSR